MAPSSQHTHATTTPASTAQHACPNRQSLLGRNILLHQQLAKLLQLFLASHLLHQQGHLDDVEILGIQLLILVQVLLLHFPPGIALLTLARLFGKQQLVHDDAVRVDAVARQLLDHALRLVETQELGDADAHKGRQVGVLELRVYLGDCFAQRLELLHHLVEVLSVGEGAARAEDAVEQGPVLGGELGDLGEGLFEDRWELEEAQGVAGGRGVEDDGFVGERLDLFEDLGKGHGFVDTGDLFLETQR